MRMGGSFIDKTLFDAWLVDVQIKEPVRHDQIMKAKDGKLIICLRKFLYEDYIFKAWR